MKINFPDPLVLLLSCIILSAVLTYIIPAGSYERKENQSTGRMVVVPNSYSKAEQKPISFFNAVVAIPKGLIAASDVIFLVFLVGGAFVVVDKTGVLQGSVDYLLRSMKGDGQSILITVSLIFFTLGALENMQEEIIPLVPVLLVLTKRLGFPNLTAVAISVGAAAVGASFSPINPFQVGIAQKIAELPLLSGSGYRVVLLLIAFVVYMYLVVRHAIKNRQNTSIEETKTEFKFDTRMRIVLVILLLTFVLFVYGVMQLGWDFNQMTALFFLMGIAIGLLGRLGIKGTSDAFVDGFRSMAYAAMIIGFARGIFVVLEEGQIIDTIVYGLFTPLAELPNWLSITGVTLVQSVLHFPVPSVSGQAVLTIPILNPLSDLLGISRQIIVMSYQYGAGLCELITPTNGALVAVVSAAGMKFNTWFKFAIKVYLILIGLGLTGIYLAIAFKLV